MQPKQPLPYNQAYNYALRLLNQRSYSEYALAQKLKHYNASSEDITKIIEKLRRLNLINDQAYAASLARTESQYRHTSCRLITQKLRQKGIDQAIIEKSVQETADTSPEEERAFYHAKRYLDRHTETEKHKFKQKLAGYLYRKGFSSSVIYKMLKHIES